MIASFFFEVQESVAEQRRNAEVTSGSLVQTLGVCQAVEKEMLRVC